MHPLPPPYCSAFQHTHMSESEHQHLCKCYISPLACDTEVWRGGKCRKRKSSAVLLLVCTALDYTISFWFGLEVCVRVFIHQAAENFARAHDRRAVLHTCIIFHDYVCTHIGSVTTPRLIEDDVLR